MNVTPEFMSNDRISMEWFADVLGTMLGRPIIDKTGFAGSFRLRFEFAPLTPVGDVDSTKPSIFTAFDEQLGLKPESGKGTKKFLSSIAWKGRARISRFPAAHFDSDI
jgi:uncharacterized protein (TIGR03435 family)